MTFHDDSSGKKAAKRKRKLVPIPKRKIVGDCEPGDRIRLDDGREAVVTAWLNNGPMGRFIEPDGREGEFVALDASLPMTRTDGYR